MAPQFSATNGPSRSEMLCIVSAANSLPVLAACGRDIDSLVENEYIIKPNCEGSSVGVIKFDTKKDLVSHIVRNNIDLKDFVVERFVT